MSRPYNKEVFKAIMLVQNLDNHNVKVKNQLEMVAREIDRLERFKEKIMKHWEGSIDYKPDQMYWQDFVDLFEDDDEMLKEMGADSVTGGE